jgi:hypothetical protein
MYGVLLVNDCPQVELLNTRILNNTATFNSAITSVSSDLRFDNMTINDNRGGEVTISATYSTLVFNNTMFDGNTATLVSNGFQMINSDVTLRNTIIQNSVSKKSEVGFFNMMIESNL